MLCAVYCTFGALISAFDFPVDMTVLFSIFLLNSITLSIIAILYRGKGILALLIPASVLFIWNFSGIIEGAKWVIFYITEYYNRWILVSVQFPEAEMFTEGPTVFLAAAGIAVTFILAVAICLRRSTFLVIISTAPIVFLTFIITDTLADTIYIFGLIAVYLTLLISSAFNPDDFLKRGLIFAPVFLLAMLLMGVTYLLASPNSNNREYHLQVLDWRIRTIVWQLGQMGNPGANLEVGWPEGTSGGSWMYNTNNVSVADAGERVMTGVELLEVVSSASGTFYLRGYSMDSFDGRSWKNKSDFSMLQDEELARNTPALIAAVFESSGNSGDAVSVAGIDITQIGDITNVDYLPYYFGDNYLIQWAYPGYQPHEKYFLYTTEPIHRLVSDEKIIFHNTPTDESFIYVVVGDESRYDDVLNNENYFSIIVDPNIYIDEDMYSDGNMIFDDGSVIRDQIEFWSSITDYSVVSNVQLSDYNELVLSSGKYTEVDGNTAQALRQLAADAGIDPTSERVEVVDAVAKYIRSSAVYTLSPATIPRGEDFALYFLETTKEGYCIHFATAAVLMLRSLGVPARFVSGFVATVSQSNVGNTVVLTDANAHAWVEVYYDNIGWLYLEVTPSAAGSVIPDARLHAPETPTPPPDSPLPTERPDFDETPPDDIDPRGNGQSWVGSGNIAGDQATQAFYRALINISIAIICIAVCMLALRIRRKIIIKRRNEHFKQSNTNTAVIYMWRYIVRLSKREAVPKTEIEEIALKAQFSQHRLTEKERTEVINYTKRLADEVYLGRRKYSRLWLKYIRAL